MANIREDERKTIEILQSILADYADYFWLVSDLINIPRGQLPLGYLSKVQSAEFLQARERRKKRRGEAFWAFIDSIFEEPFRLSLCRLNPLRLQIKDGRFCAVRNRFWNFDLHAETLRKMDEEIGKFNFRCERLIDTSAAAVTDLLKSILDVTYEMSHLYGNPSDDPFELTWYPFREADKIAGMRLVYECDEGGAKPIKFKLEQLNHYLRRIQSPEDFESQSGGVSPGKPSPRGHHGLSRKPTVAEATIIQAINDGLRGVRLCAFLDNNNMPPRKSWLDSEYIWPGKYVAAWNSRGKTKQHWHRMLTIYATNTKRDFPKLIKVTQSPR